MILFDDVSKVFRRRKQASVQALQHISLHVPKGMTVGLVGPTGAGKTTLLKLACGALRPDAGRVRVNGFDPVRDRRRLAGQVSILLADRSNANVEHSLREEVSLLGAAYRIKPYELKKRSGELIERFSLETFCDEPLKNVSLGFRRRAEAVLAFLAPAELILFDEPCIGMDAGSKEMFMHAVETERKRGRTVMISSHHMEEIEALAQRIIVLNKGQLLYYGGKTELMRRLAPVNRMELTFSHRVPDLQDLPFIRYEQEGRTMCLDYNRNQITAAELLRGIQETGCIEKLNMQHPSLEDVIRELQNSWK